MDDYIININFNGINGELFFYLNDNTISIIIRNNFDIIISNNIYIINYYIDETFNNKIYYIKLNKDIKDLLENENFLINLPKNFNYHYTYYNNEPNKSIIIYPNYNYLPLIYLGLPNNKFIESFKIDFKYNLLGSENTIDCSGSISPCCSTDCSGNYDNSNITYITLFNNYFGNNNYFLNMLKLNGDIFQLCIPNNTGITSYDSNNNIISNYELYKIKNTINISPNTNIYFNDCSGNINPISYIINLNNYNYSPIRNVPNYYENIIFGINYIDSSGNLLVDSSGNICESILSLGLQTYNPNQICSTNDINGNNYYNVLFFYNYIDNEYNTNIVNMFSYDYEKYFDNTILPVEYYNINSSQSTLYDDLILNDINLDIPIILDLQYTYLFINLDLIYLQKNLINPEFLNNYVYNFTKSTKINLEIMINYLINFIFKEYNIFKIINIKKKNIPDNQFIIKNYLYQNESLYQPTKNIPKFNKIINFNNNIVNCIRCKIIFYYSSDKNKQINGMYTVDGKLFLNNYNLEIYHKKYDFTNVSTDDNKKKLINMLLWLGASTYKIKLFFYNKKNSVVPAFYLFNQINLFKINNDFKIQFELTALDNNYTNGYIQLNTNINIQYYILFLYANNNTFLNQSNFDELIFLYNSYIFKLLKINSPNGNLNKDKIIFYICFQNLKEINIFMEFIKNGILNTQLDDNNLSNYFNIEKSITFYNYYDLNNYWIIDSTQPINKYEIFFSINNLHIEQIYLYGDLFIETI